MRVTMEEDHTTWTILIVANGMVEELLQGAW